MPEITKQEALRRLAEWMGWTCAPYDEWEPFDNLNHAFELQARLPKHIRWQYCNILAGEDQWSWNLVTATADQRTRAICRVLWNVEVIESKRRSRSRGN